MTATLETTDLPLTDDGWTVEMLDIFTDDDRCDHVGGDIQVGAAPSIRHRFVSPDGGVLVLTTYAYVTAAASIEAVRMGFVSYEDELDFTTLEELRERIAEHERATGEKLDTMIWYHHEVVVYADYWEAGNTDQDRPDFEDVEHLWDLRTFTGLRTLEDAEDRARAEIKSMAETGARDWNPSLFIER